MLRVDGVTLSYGGVKAVSNASLSVGEGRIVGLIGTNGAGKTSLFNVISGFTRAQAGRVALGGEDITHLSPSAIAARGLVRTFQTPVGFPRMTVYENMLVFSVRERESRERLFAREQFDSAQHEAIRGVLEGMHLWRRRDEWVEDLSAPELKMLEFARAMIAEPRILLLDEPAAGVNPALLENLEARIAALRAAGMTFLVVDHNLKFVCAVCDEIYAMADGEVIAHGTPDEVIANPRVIDLYIGSGASPEPA